MVPLDPYLFPDPLQPGDRVAVIAPSGALLSTESIQAGLARWQQQGFAVDCLPGYDQAQGYLAGTDDDRRAQLQAALTGSRYRAIVCARGGYGAARLLENWDWPLFATGRAGLLSEAPAIAPKWLVGFSDITALLWSLARQGIGSLHGPVLTTLAQEPDWSTQRLFDALARRPLEPLSGTPWRSGVATGRLLPANLTVATHLLNTRLQPALEGMILALEDVGEAPYRLDRMLTQWRMNGALAAVSGIALGRFSSCDPPGDRPSFSVTEVLRDRLTDLGIPLVADLPFGHEGVNATLPVGAIARLDGNTGTLSIQES